MDTDRHDLDYDGFLCDVIISSKSGKPLNIPSETDERLMERFAQTLSDDAFTELSARYHASALRMAASMLQGLGMADDAVQEAFIRVVKHRQRYDGRRPFAAWFYTILRNICLDIRKKEMRFSHAVGEAVIRQDIANEIRTPDIAMTEILSKIEPEDQQLLIMKVVNGLTFKEVAEWFGCSEEAAKKRAQRALRRLRDTAICRQKSVPCPFQNGEGGNETENVPFR